MFPLTLGNFRISFPEFNGVTDVMVQAMLNAAQLSIDEQVWGAKAYVGHGYLTAHQLCSSPWGQNARLISKDGSGSTVYQKQYKRLQLEVTPGYRVC